ncbi:hypothetical protein ACP_2215 [Acidobacterium capsulatum ATCC 51196]|uniref:Uncharacterized protein n=1 Tax=Acidobacterium capsulatum (strain ATCC 51196 / DSM 11244 / BCRC 80197 / JCM 7670 / NBRC 15755 / NCIMB 13165 / 161) TaxID=240015 RepID=C1F9Q6_ACIC5|nr:hypothetical protein ACP_2215 [Acidobacterium capsulatum ATCC 51196]
MRGESFDHPEKNEATCAARRMRAEFSMERDPQHRHTHHPDAFHDARHPSLCLHSLPPDACFSFTCAGAALPWPLPQKRSTP